MKGLNTQRANTATRIHHNCSAIFGLLDTDLVDPEERKAKFRGRIGWVPNGSSGGTYSSVDVDIIHKDYSGKYISKNERSVFWIVGLVSQRNYSNRFP